jgi:eukaryotic-like serine/threonine-protein kinase
MADDGRWQQVDALFAAALEIDASSRASFIAAQCDGDEWLAESVGGLFRSADEADALFEGSAILSRAKILSDAFAGLDEDINRAEAALLGTQLGAFELIDLIGRGGSAAVYLGERVDSQYRQRVAIKVARQGLADRDAEQRFRAERQILANLDHPNIARLLDGGTTDAGQPYLVMEYIDGESIDVYCNQRQLSVDARLGLFSQICAAVHDAHQHLIVHRDLKPANVLVSADGIPKLLDFGIAKLLDTTQLQHTVAMTRADVRLLTLQYASPEQIKGEAITTASDVYALGVMLYELLTGHMPHRLRSTRLGELERVICDTQPKRPSTMVIGDPPARGDTDAIPQTIGEARNTEPKILRKQLQGDLDNIVLMALRKEPERRYRSAAQFAEDLRRYRECLPVIAHPDTVGYRVNKFARRNTAGLATTVAVIALIVGLVGFYTWQVTGERNRAEREAGKAAAISAFFQGMLESVDPDQAQGEVVTVRQVLDETANKLEKNNDMRDQPEVEAAVRATLGVTYLALGIYDQAEPQLTRALGLRQAEMGETSPDSLRSMLDIASLYRQQGRYQEAERTYSEALELARRVLGAAHPVTLQAMNDLAVVHNDQGRYAEAETLLQEVLQKRRQVLGAEEPETLDTMNYLALLYWGLDRHNEAEPLMLETIAGRRRSVGDHHPSTLLAMNNLALLYYSQEKFEQAEPIFLEALAAQRRVLGDEHPDTLLTMSNLANLYYHQGRFEETGDYMLQVLNARKRKLGEEHPRTLQSMNNLAILYFSQQRYQDALPVLEEVLKIQRRVVGEEHTDTLGYMTSLAQTYERLGRYADAESLSLELLEVSRGLLGEDHKRTLDATYHLASLYEKQRRYAEAKLLAIPYHERVLQKYGAEHKKTRNAVALMTRLDAALGTLATAAE